MEQRRRADLNYMQTSEPDRPLPADRGAPSEQPVTVTLAVVAGRLTALLGVLALPLYGFGVVVTRGGTRWAMLAMIVILALALARGTKSPTPIEAAGGAFLCVIAVVTWGACVPGQTAVRAVLLAVSMVYVGLMLLRPFAEIALVASVLAYVGSDRVFGTGRWLDLQVAAIAVTALCLGLLMLGIRITTERKVNEHTQALAAANELLELLNRTDPLTGLANRRRLDLAVAESWERAGKNTSPVSVIMVDIDYFKQYNDQFGHPGGDSCLRKVAVVLTASARTTDIVARYGGEEFAVILPDTDLDAACLVAERIRETVVQLEEEHPASPTGYLTVSLGVATAIPGGEPGGPDLLKRADENLYAAKNRGRNQVAIDQAAELTDAAAPAA
jgi:diguanylate cyclase (GGDEF)-like protein